MPILDPRRAAVALLAGQVAALLEVGDFEGAAALTTALRALHRPKPAEVVGNVEASGPAGVVDLAAERDRRGR